MGEKGTEKDGGAWGEIRNEREEKPRRTRVRKGADEIRGTFSGVPWTWSCIVMGNSERTTMYVYNDGRWWLYFISPKLLTEPRNTMGEKYRTGSE